MPQREMLTGMQGRVYTTLPSNLRRSTTSLRKDSSLVGLIFPQRGFYRVAEGQGGSKGQERGKRLRTYARSKGYEAETISQPLSWRQDMTSTSLTYR